MKYLTIATLAALLILSACSFTPVLPQAQWESYATARAMPVPPLPTMTDPVVPPTPALIPTVTSTPECLIKVNKASDGTLVYHLPGQPTYNQTKVETAKGEFFACDEQQAIDAGARKAQR